MKFVGSTIIYSYLQAIELLILMTKSAICMRKTILIKLYKVKMPYYINSEVLLFLFKNSCNLFLKMEL